MSVDANLRVAGWVSHFLSVGAAGPHTKPFADVDMATAATLTKELNLAPDELPAIADFRSNEDWVLLTSERLAWKRAGVLEAVDVAAIRDATVDFRDVVASGKRQLARLLVNTTGGTITLFLDPGEPFFGFWNVLKGIAAGNAARRDRKVP